MKQTKEILKVAIVASIYVVLTFIFLPFSFSFIQFRLSEILCLLSTKYKWSIISITIGCFLSNLLMGGLGMIDVVFGTAASLIACVFSYKLRNKRYKGYPLLSGLAIVLCNAIIVGIEYSIIFNNIKIMPIYIAQIGISELAVVFIGLLVYPKLEKLVNKYFR